MKHIVQILLVGFLVLSCGSNRKIVTKKSKDKTNNEVVEKRSDEKISEEVTTKDKPLKKTPVINSTTEYISVFKDIAIAEMNSSGIPASITLAQGILESGSGKGRLAVKANNHFGIKCHGWTGEKIYHDDDRSQECFRKYQDAKTSFKDHSEFLTGRKRYSKLFQLKKDDYKGWAKELRRAGYATDRRYPEKLIALIERYELYQYDAVVLNDPKSIPEQHIVVQGDTLYAISKRYNISIATLKSLNGLNTNDLEIGQVLRLQ